MAGARHNPVEIALRGIPASDALQRYIDSAARKLDQAYAGIRSSQVVVEALEREQEQAARFAVRLIITLPGTEVVVNREHGEDVYMALRDAFTAARLQLEDRLCRRSPEHGRHGHGTPGSRS